MVFVIWLHTAGMWCWRPRDSAISDFIWDFSDISVSVPYRKICFIKKCSPNDWSSEWLILFQATKYQWHSGKSKQRQNSHVQICVLLLEMIIKLVRSCGMNGKRPATSQLYVRKFILPPSSLTSHLSLYSNLHLTDSDAEMLTCINWFHKGSILSLNRSSFQRGRGHF